MKLTKEQRQTLKQKYGGRCAYCGEELKPKWHADHLKPVKRNLPLKDNTPKEEHPENDNLDNYMPSCISCNIDKNSLDLEDWRWMIKNKVVCLNRDNTTYQKAKRYGLVVETDIDVVFYFEKECA